LSKTDNQVDEVFKETKSQNKRYETKPIIQSSLYFSKDGKYLIFEKIEKHIFPASYHLKLVDNEIEKNKGDQQCKS